MTKSLASTYGINYLLGVTSAAVRALVATLVLLVPGVAAACPACARDGDGVLAKSVMVASIIAFPFLLAAVVYKVIRRVERGGGDGES